MVFSVAPNFRSSRTPFVCAIVLSALLLFNIEPLFGRMMLPLAGGSPAVWNVAMFCFQALLLAGYAYAHALQRFASLRNQLFIHFGVLALAVSSLPIRIDQAAAEANGEAYLTMFIVLLKGVGLPFFALSASGPLLQAWYARLHGGDSARTYALYAASNFGSLVGLLAYPLVLEPFSGIHLQVGIWAAGFLAYIVCIFGIAVMLLRAASPERAHVEPAPRPVSTIGGMQRLRWIGFAAIPTSLMLAVTTGMTNFIAPLPLLWVAPLCLYLLTFIFTFSDSPFTGNRAKYIVERAFVIALCVCMGTVGLNKILPWPAEIALLLTVFFLVAMRAHTVIYQERPEAAALTDFYLCISLGSVAGGLFNAIVAPLIFTNIYELGLTLIAAAFCFAPNDEPETKAPIKIVAAGVLAIVLAGTSANLLAVRGGHGFARPDTDIVMGLVIVSAYLLSVRRRVFGGVLSAIFLAGIVWSYADGSLIAQSRNFFGVKTVSDNADHTMHYLVHSGTVHGAQFTSAAKRCTPLGYYAHESGIGRFFESATGRSARSVAVIGLGAGTLAAYIRPGTAWTFYEIDPRMYDIAASERLFSYLGRCGGNPPVVIGDARIMLQRTNARYDVMIFDAFTSDQIPVHLVTREAVESYLRHLEPGGYLAFHITNRLFRLAPVFANIASDRHLSAIVLTQKSSARSIVDSAVFPSQWVVLARTPADLRAVRASGAWQPLVQSADLPVWTDDYSSLMRILK